MLGERTQRAASYNWRALLLAVCFSQATAIIGFDFTVPFIPLYLQRDLGIHGLGQVALWAGLIGFGPAIPATIFGPLWGRLADRFGYRTMLLRAMICSAAILALMGAVPNPFVLLALRMVQGALTGTVFAAQALVASAVPEKETARSMGLLQMSIFVGGTLGPVGGGAVAGLLGFRTTYGAAGILMLLATVIVLLFVREPEHHNKRRAQESTGARPSVLSVLAIPSFALALVLTLSVQLAGTSLTPVVPLFVQTLLGSAHNVPEYTGWLLAVVGIAAGGGSYVTGRLIRTVNIKILIAVCLVLSALLYIPQSLAQTYLQLLLFRAAGSLAFGGLLALVSTLAATSSPRNAKGTAFGLVGAASSLGFGVGPLLGGSIVAAVGIRPAFMVSSVLLLAVPPLLSVLVLSLPRLFRVAPISSPSPVEGD